MYKIMKKYIWNQTSKRVFFFKLTTNDRTDKMFLLTSKFRPQGIFSPCPGDIYMYKIMKKKLYKIRLRRDFLETCSKWPSDKWFLLTSNFCPLVCLPLTCGYRLLNDDPGLTLIIFMPRSNLFLMLQYGWQLIEHLVLLFFQQVKQKSPGTATRKSHSQPLTPEGWEKGHRRTCAQPTNNCTRSIKTSYLFPKQGDQNAKRTEETHKQRKRQDQTWSAS